MAGRSIPRNPARAGTVGKAHAAWAAVPDPGGSRAERRAAERGQGRTDKHGSGHPDEWVSVRSVAKYLGVPVRELVEQFPDLEGRQTIRLGPARDLIEEWEKS